MKHEKLNGKTIEKIVEVSKYGLKHIEVHFTDGTHCLIDSKAIYLNGSGVVATLY